MHTGDPITPEALAAELDRICESPAFRHSLRHQQFLRHLIACKLGGQLAALREIALGIDFFGRAPSTYDPKTDAVVRIEAGRLRQRLDRYYHGEGIDAPFEISLDKGSYLPQFRVRAPAAVTIGAQPSIAVLPLSPATPAPADMEFSAALTAGARSGAGFFGRGRRFRFSRRGPHPTQGRVDRASALGRRRSKNIAARSDRYEDRCNSPRAPDQHAGCRCTGRESTGSQRDSPLLRPAARRVSGSGRPCVEAIARVHTNPRYQRLRSL